MRQDFAFDFQKSLLPMIAEQLITADGATILTERVADLLEDYATEVAEKLLTRAKEWELSMGEDDKTLYSLGLRHAIDTITETDPTDA